MTSGRKLTPELQGRILAFVRAGNSPYSAARASGVAKSTWYSWLKAGRKGKDPACAELVEELDCALAAAQVTLVAIIRSAATRDWRAALALLERRWPRAWGRKDRHTLTHVPAGPQALTEDDRRRIEAMIREEAQRVGSTRAGRRWRAVDETDGAPESRN